MNSIVLSLFAGFALFLTACSTTYHLPKPPNIYTSQSPYPSKTIPAKQRSAFSDILYVTDRKPETSKKGNLEYGSNRSTTLQYGTARVEIGENRSWEEIVAAANSDIKRVKFTENVRELSPEGEYPSTPLLFTMANGIAKIDAAQSQDLRSSREGFQSFVSEALSKSRKKDVIVFVHGFNVSFEKAIFTVNDIYHYSGRSAVPISYTWPAHNGNIFAYFQDQGSADYTVFHLKQFFRTLMSMEEIDNIHVVAHSLGTVATTTALRELLIETRAAGKNPLEAFNIENLILAAPDLDYGVVTQRLISEQFSTAFGRMTVYTNDNDKALSLSSFLTSSLRFGNLLPSEEGEVEKEIFERVGNVDYITVNGSTPGFSNHAYFVKDPAALSDIVTLINTSDDPGTETRPLKNLGGNFWVLEKGYLKPSNETPKTPS